MTDRPIIFSASMVKALLAGRKTQTRRLLGSDPDVFKIDGKPAPLTLVHVKGDRLPRVAIGRVITHQEVRYAVGNRLWVRENARRNPHLWCYSADSEEIGWPGRASLAHFKRDNAPSIHLPRSASRLTLAVTDVRVQRLQEISEEDAKAEGCGLFVPGHGWITEADLWEGYSNFLCPRSGFQDIWGEINGPDAWSANPWVVAVSFTVIRANIDALPPHPVGEVVEG